MLYREIPGSGIRVSAFCLGTMGFGAQWHGAGPIAEKTARRLVDAALDAGVNFIDTADIYGRGAAETLLGRILGKRRSKVVLASKVMSEMRRGDPSSGGLSRRHITEGLNDSLRRLKTDYLDLYMPHIEDPKVPAEESLEAFDRAVKAGKVRVLGCSNFSGAAVGKWLDLGSGRGWAGLKFNEVQYSLAARFWERELVPVWKEREVGLLAWSPLGGGLLTGKYSRGKTRPAGRRQDPDMAFPPLPEGRLQGLIKVLGKVAEIEGLTIAQTALGWVMSKPWVISTIVGARDLSQLEENLGAKSLRSRSVSILDKASALCLGL